MIILTKISPCTIQSLKSFPVKQNLFAKSPIRYVSRKVTQIEVSGGKKSLWTRLTDGEFTSYIKETLSSKHKGICLL